MKKFLGAPYPIIRTPLGLMATQSGTDQIKSDLLCLLLTNPGERCLTGDVKIPLADGTEFTIQELVEKPDFWVYSFDIKSNLIVPGKAKAYKTVKNAELFEVTLDNNESVKCTPDHLWLLRNGEYRAANQLRVGDSLMPLYRNLNSSKYERIYQPSIKKYKETHLCFVSEKRLSGIREVVHHKDLNKRNNSPDNLQWMTCKDHMQLHKEINNAFIKKIKEDPEFKKNWIENLKKGLTKYYKNHDGNRKNSILSEETKKKLSDGKKEFYKTKNGSKLKQILSQKALEQFEKNGHPSIGKKHTDDAKNKMSKPRASMNGDNNPSKRPEVREKLKAAWIKRKELKNLNHKIKSIKKLDFKEDCYDLKVNEYHNFALSAGVFVHNCMLPDFGTPLRRLLFEPNDLTLANRARETIITAIKTWEPRIVVDQIEVFSGADLTSLDSNDTKQEIEHILSIKIMFSTQESIKDIQTLSLELPLAPEGS